MKSCCRTMKSSLRSDEIRALPRTNEIKSTHRRSDFIRRRRISYREAVFHPPVRVDFIEKSNAFFRRDSTRGARRALVGRGSDSPPASHSLPRLFESLNCCQTKQKTALSDGFFVCERLPKRYISKVKLPKRYTFRLPLSMRLRQSDTIPFLRRVHLRVPPGNAGIPRLPYPKPRRSNSPSAS